MDEYDDDDDDCRIEHLNDDIDEYWPNEDKHMDYIDEYWLDKDNLDDNDNNSGIVTDNNYEIVIHIHPKPFAPLPVLPRMTTDTRMSSTIFSICNNEEPIYTPIRKKRKITELINDLKKDERGNYVVVVCCVCYVVFF